MKKQLRKLLNLYKNRKKLFVVSSIISAFIVVFITALVYTNLLTIYSGGTRLLTTCSVSKGWSIEQIDSYIENIKNKSNLEYQEYEKGYSIMRGMKDGTNTEADLNSFLKTKNDKYGKIISFMDIFQYIVILGILPIIVIIIGEVTTLLKLVFTYLKSKVHRSPNIK